MEREINLTDKSNIFHGGSIPCKKTLDKFIIGFHGKFIPLQGVQYIIKAAHLLADNEDIFFSIIGNGQTFKEATALAKKLNLKNIHFHGKLALEELPSHLRQFDVCLGIFGNTPKTQRVIPNKVYESIAMARPIISAKTPAMSYMDPLGLDPRF